MMELMICLLDANYLDRRIFFMKLEILAITLYPIHKRSFHPFLRPENKKKAEHKDMHHN